MSGEISAFDRSRSEAPAPVRVVPPKIPDLDPQSISELLYTLTQARWLIAATVLAFVFLGGLYVALATPTYRSDVVVQVEDTNKSIAGLAEAVVGERPPSEAQMEILRSRSLIGTVVDQLKLDLVAEPRWFPIVGAPVARRYAGAAPARPWLGLRAYAWGGERIKVERLEVPPALLNEELTLVAGESGRFALRTRAGAPILEGQVGRAAVGNLDGRVELFVSDLSARPQTRFRLTKRGHLRVVEELQDAVKISEKGRRTGVLAVALDGPDPAAAAATLDAIAATYVRQNVERKSAEAAKTLEFLETQLPTLKANLDAAEAALQGYQVRTGTIDLSRDAQAMLTRSVEIERALSDAELQRSDLRQKFTESHPALVSLTDKIEKLRAERGAINGKMRNLPGNELESTRLTRDVKVASELYNLLLNKAQELRVVKSGTIGNVRVLDWASVGDRPVRPIPALVLVVCTILGLGVGVAAAFTRKSLYAGLDDPEVVERVTGVTVYATVPRSTKQAAINRAGGRRGPSPLLALVESGDPAVEAMRSLRTGLQFALLESRNNVIMITGPTADVGKSFVSANLAHVLAAAGRRVVVVDGDLRRGRVHRFFDGGRSPGLSELLTGTATAGEAVHRSNVENLYWVPTGRLPPNPAELLGSDRFGRALADLAKAFDLVLVDTAPILPVTDAAIIGRHAGTTLMVLRAGAHPTREVLSAVKRLAQNGVQVQGAVFNDVSGAGARYSKYGYQYRYDSRA